MMGKVAVAGISLILVVGVIIGVVATVSRGNATTTAASQGGISTGMKAVETLCAPTEHKDVCMKTLSPIAQSNGNANPKDLVEATFGATMDAVKQALETSSSLGQTAANNTNYDDYDKMSLQGCKTLLGYAVFELESAMYKLTHTEMHTLADLVADLKNWLGAVYSYRTECIDDLKHPELQKSMGDGLLNATQLTDNAIGIVNEVSNILSKINITIPTNLNHNSRRLLHTEVDEDNYPTWLSGPDRKLLAAPRNQVRPNVVVAQDGSGQFRTINQALAAYPKNNRGRFIIYVKAGIYRENVEVSQKHINVFMYGDGPKRTIVTGDRDVFRKKFSTFMTATFAALGDGFIAKSMAFQNTAGPEGHQAVALRTQSEKAAFFNCRFDAYQDTLYYQAKRSFFRNCVISGTIDFIFGMGSAVIQNSNIIVRKGISNQNTVTADGNQKQGLDGGLVIQNCNIVAERRLIPHRMKVASYLGRPWKNLARTMVMETTISDVIRPEGWLLWQGENYHNTCEYREYANKGPGANTNLRVKWRGFQVVTDRRVAERYAAATFIQGTTWLRYAGMPFTLGLNH